MNKNQLTMAVTGGVGAAVALVFFALVFMNGSTIDQRKQEVADLQNKCSALNGVSRDKTIAEDIKEIDGLMSERYDSMVNTNLVRHAEKSENELQQAINTEFREIKSWPSDSTVKIIPGDFLAKNGDQNFKVFYNYVKDDGAVAPKNKLLVARQWSDFYHIMELMRGQHGLGTLYREKNRKNGSCRALSIGIRCFLETFPPRKAKQPKNLPGFWNLLRSKSRFGIPNTIYCVFKRKIPQDIDKQKKILYNTDAVALWRLRQHPLIFL